MYDFYESIIPVVHFLAQWLFASEARMFLSLKGGPAGSAMKILYQVVILLALGGFSCQNKSNSKPSGKASKKGGSQAGDGAHEDDAAGGPADGGRGNSQQSASSSKAADEMKLHFLKNSQITCNDGTAAG